MSSSCTIEFSIEALYFHCAVEASQRANLHGNILGLMERRLPELDRELAERAPSGNDDEAGQHEKLAEERRRLPTAWESVVRTYVESLVVAHVNSAAALEAHINVEAAELLGRTELEAFDKLPLDGKWHFLPRVLALPGFPFGEEPMQTICRVHRLRNKLLHYKSRRFPYVLGEPVPFAEPLGLHAREAARSVEAVREAVSALAAQRGSSAPAWLAAKPSNYFAMREG